MTKSNEMKYRIINEKSKVLKLYFIHNEMAYFIGSAKKLDSGKYYVVFYTIGFKRILTSAIPANQLTERHFVFFDSIDFGNLSMYFFSGINQETSKEAEMQLKDFVNLPPALELMKIIESIN